MSTAVFRVIARVVPPVNIKKKANQQLLKLRKKCSIGDVTSPLNEKWKAKK